MDPIQDTISVAYCEHDAQGWEATWEPFGVIPARLLHHLRTDVGYTAEVLFQKVWDDIVSVMFWTQLTPDPAKGGEPLYVFKDGLSRTCAEQMRCKINFEVVTSLMGLVNDNVVMTRTSEELGEDASEDSEQDRFVLTSYYARGDWLADRPHRTVIVYKALLPNGAATLTDHARTLAMGMNIFNGESVLLSDHGREKLRLFRHSVLKQKRELDAALRELALMEQIHGEPALHDAE